MEPCHYESENSVSILVNCSCFHPDDRTMIMTLNLGIISLYHIPVESLCHALKSNNTIANARVLFENSARFVRVIYEYNPLRAAGF